MSRKIGQRGSIKRAIAIVNYGAGNLRSLQKAFDHLGFGSVITDKKKDILDSSGLVLPGVGAFGYAVKYLKDLKIFSVIKDMILSNKPFLGICLGMQLLFDKSEEDKKIKGFDIIKGDVRKFKAKNYKVPHMGWNTVKKISDCPITRKVENNSFFYFVHSYYCEICENNVIAGMTDYGIGFASILCKGNIFCTQFHPEKSGKNGLLVLRSFGEKCDSYSRS